MMSFSLFNQCHITHEFLTNKVSNLLVARMIAKINMFYILKSIHAKLFVSASTRFLDTRENVFSYGNANLLNHCLAKIYMY